MSEKPRTFEVEFHLAKSPKLAQELKIDEVAIRPANVFRKRKPKTFSRETVIRLAAILRVADGFDRGHTAAVEAIKARWMPRALRLTAVPNPKAGSIRLDLWGAARKSRLLSEIANTPVEIVAPDGKVLTYDDEEGEPD